MKFLTGAGGGGPVFLLCTTFWAKSFLQALKIKNK